MMVTTNQRSPRNPRAHSCCLALLLWGIRVWSRVFARIHEAKWEGCKCMRASIWENRKGKSGFEAMIMGACHGPRDLIDLKSLGFLRGLPLESCHNVSRHWQRWLLPIGTSFLFGAGCQNTIFNDCTYIYILWLSNLNCAWEKKMDCLDQNEANKREKNQL